MTDPSPAPISRRTIVTGAAWAVPAIALTTATPAFAASGSPTLTLSAPNGQTTAGDATTITAVVKDSAGQPLGGQRVFFNEVAGATFSPTEADTDGDGKVTSNLTIADRWAKPGSTITVSAVANGVTGSGAFTVLGANAYAVGRNYYNDPTKSGNLYGKLGTGSSASFLSTPAQLLRVFPSPIVTIADSRDHALALLEDGSVWALGRNNNGQLGDGTFVTRSTWAPVHNLTGVKQIAASAASSYALLSDGTVMAWGSNLEGRLGTKTETDNNSLPVKVNTGSATQIAAGAFAGYAVLTDGTVSAWGYNASGQLGNAKPKNDQTNPVIVAGVRSAVQVTGGARSAYALLKDGTVMAWGETIGDSTTTVKDPHPVDKISGVSALAAGDRCVYALLSDRTVAAWGDNEKGQLGSGNFTSSTEPVAVKGLNDARVLTSSYGSGFVKLGNGTIEAWGWNQDGQLGNGNTTDQNSPVSVTAVENIARFGVPSSHPSSGWFIRST